MAVAPDGSVWVVTQDDYRVRRIWRPTPSTDVTGITLSLESEAPVATVGYQSGAVQIKAEDQAGSALPGIPILYEGNANSLGRVGPVVTSETGTSTVTLSSSMSAGEYDYFAYAEDIHGMILATIPFTFNVTAVGSGNISSLVNIGHATGAPYDTDWAPTARGGTPRAVSVRDDGTVYWSYGGRVFAIYPDGTMRRIAGGGSADSNNIPARSASIGTIYALTVNDATDRLFIATYYDIFVLELDGGIIWRLTGAGSTEVEGGAASDWALTDSPNSLAVNTDGTELFFATNFGFFSIDLSVTPATRRTILATVTNAAANCANTADVPYPYSYRGIAYGTDDLLYLMSRICESNNTVSEALYTVDPANGAVVRLANISHSVKGDMAFDSLGDLYFANQDEDSIMKFDGTTFSVVAGDGVGGETGDLGPAVDARVDFPYSVAVDGDDNLYVPDYYNDTIRKIWR
jgi:hypothetical protein